MRNKLAFLKKANVILAILAFYVIPVTYSQERGFARVMFYNTENLFDVVDDPETLDEEFLPNADRHWTKDRFNHKIQKIAQVFIAVGGWEAPEVIGLCEVENRFVLEQLTSQTVLKKLGYKMIHKESPDRRGIDVALLYREDVVTPLHYEYLSVDDKDSPDFKTRDILHFAGVIKGVDTLHIFVNHWPSRYGGLLETVPKRALAANVLKREIDSLQAQFLSPKIIVMGDFNDQPTDKSLVEVLKAQLIADEPKANDLYNLSGRWMDPNAGTLKYQSQWSVFDQVLVSGDLLAATKGVFCLPGDAHIFSAPFLLVDDNTYNGMKPKRTYTGFAYTGGFSDHLPVYLDLWQK